MPHPHKPESLRLGNHAREDSRSVHLQVYVSLRLAVKPLAKPASEGVPILVAIRTVEGPPQAEDHDGHHDPRIDVVVATHVGTLAPHAVKIGKGVETMRPTRTWWMKRHDTVNYVILSVVLLLMVWTAIFP